MEISAEMGTVLISLAVLAVLILPSIRRIGPTEVGLVIKRFGNKLDNDNIVAFNGEAGYQADLLMPGFRFKLWILYKVDKYPWVQVPAGQIGVAIAQIGHPLPMGAKSAVYKEEFGDFTNLEKFIKGGGQKGVQRPVLRPGSALPIHPIAFIVLTKHKIYGVPIEPDLQRASEREGLLTPQAFGLDSEQLDVVLIEPRPVGKDGETMDMVGIVTTFDGKPLSSGYIASRLGGFSDIEELEKKQSDDAAKIELLLGDKNHLHENYQDFQKFVDSGGEMGLQHDVLRYGAYNLNPFLVQVEMVPMLIVRQGEVAVIKAYVGLSAQDTSGLEFKFGSLVRPGHRGLWGESLRTGKYALNPRIYQAEIVPTCILNLNWAHVVSEAHNLDSKLEPIVAKSREGFVFKIDLQVQIHVPDTKASRVISMVRTMQNLVNEILQAAVGNHFRDKLQSMAAVSFIETRQQVQESAFEHIRTQLEQYEVETRGVYIQDVILPDELVIVLTQREIANQQIETYKKEKAAQDQRIEMEKAKGTAEKQADLASAEVNVAIKKNNADARKLEAEGEATYLEKTGNAKGAEVRAVGLAKAEAFRAQVAALGQEATAIVNVASSLADKGAKFMPEILVTGGGGATDGVAAALMRYLKPSETKVKGSEEKPMS
ncbi:MAG: SPFH domain-containing protein [Firmicutes bacterium]|nr:SPFH domain-containing protein [Bacillota bacterium]